MDVYGSMQAPIPVELTAGRTTTITVNLDDSGTVKGIAKEQTARLAAVHGPLLPDSLPVYYTPGHGNRAQRLQGLLGGELKFYERRFKLSLDPLVLAVLDPPQWRAVIDGGPYGMPSVDLYGVPSNDFPCL